MITQFIRFINMLTCSTVYSRLEYHAKHADNDNTISNLTNLTAKRENALREERYIRTYVQYYPLNPITTEF